MSNTTAFRKTPFWRRKLGQNHFYAAVGLVAINLVVYLFLQFFSNLYGVLGLQPAAVFQEGAWWQVVTYLFVHGDLNHILYNTVYLVVVGMAVEERVRSWEFLLLYFVCGTLAGLFYVCLGAFTGFNLTYLMGASAAIYALMLAYAVFGLDGRNLFIPLAFSVIFGAFQYFQAVFSFGAPLISLMTLLQVIQVGAVLAFIVNSNWMRNAFHVVFLFAAFDLLGQVLNWYGDVSHTTHLAGFVFAFGYLIVRFRLNAWTVYRS